MAIYHLHVKTGSRSGGQSAAAKADYVEREGKYAKGKAEVQEVGHGNMPTWAASNPREYWQAADEYERANGRLFTEVEFALPLELTPEEQSALVHDFAEHLTQAENLPYTFAIHKGRYDHGGREMDTPENPHCHLVISERINDGIERSAETWFKRANKKDPTKGGAVKSEILKTRDWLCQTREQWQTFANAALERAGSEARIDHRTLEAQGITDRLPQVHLGATAHMAQRGIQTERHDQAIMVANLNQQYLEANREQAQKEAAIAKVKKLIERSVIAATTQPTQPRTFADAAVMRTFDNVQRLETVRNIEDLIDGQTRQDNLFDLPAGRTDDFQGKQRGSKHGHAEGVLSGNQPDDLSRTELSANQRMQSLQSSGSDLEDDKTEKVWGNEGDAEKATQRAIEAENSLKVEQLAASEPLNLLEMRCEILQRDLESAESDLNRNQHAIKTLHAKTETQFKRNEALKKRIDDLNAKVLGKLRHRKEIAELEAERQSNIRDNRRDNAEIRTIREQSGQLKMAIEALQRDFSIYGEALHKSADKSREKALSGLPDEVRQAWKKIEREKCSSAPFRKDNPFRQHRQMKAAFSNFLKRTEKDLSHKNQVDYRRNRKNSGLSR